MLLKMVFDRQKKLSQGICFRVAVSWLSDVETKSKVEGPRSDKSPSEIGDLAPYSAAPPLPLRALENLPMLLRLSYVHVCANFIQTLLHRDSEPRYTTAKIHPHVVACGSCGTLHPRSTGCRMWLCAERSIMCGIL